MAIIISINLIISACLIDSGIMPVWLAVTLNIWMNYNSHKLNDNTYFKNNGHKHNDKVYERTMAKV